MLCGAYLGGCAGRLRCLDVVYREGREKRVTGSLVEDDFYSLGRRPGANLALVRFGGSGERGVDGRIVECWMAADDVQVPQILSARAAIRQIPTAFCCVRSIQYITEHIPIQFSLLTVLLSLTRLCCCVRHTEPSRHFSGGRERKKN